MNKRRGVIRALWGDWVFEHGRTRVPDHHVRLLYDIRDSVDNQERTDMICCWGIENFNYCAYHGLKNIYLMRETPYEYQESRIRMDGFGGTVQWGRNHFIHKWLAIQKAMTKFDSIAVVDWDCRQVGQINDDWWERQEKVGVSFRATLHLGRRKKWWADWRGPGKNELPYFGCVWIGDKTFVADCMKLSEENPLWMQQQCVAKWFDKGRGRWKGTKVYKEQGYEADFVRMERQCFKPDRTKVVWEMTKKKRVIR